LTHRPRRNRRNASVRKLIRETSLEASDFILPLFVREGKKQRQAISSMPGVFRLSLDLLIEECQQAYELGIGAVALFPVVEDAKKDRTATESVKKNGLLQRTVREIKAKVPAMLVITDVAMDPYSVDGHDGLLKDGEILNDETLEILAKMAVSQAEAGADFVAPSDMMDGRVGYIRRALDKAGHEHVGILAYSAKYASAFYGPFREALDSQPRSGDKKTYQMDPANRREAIREVLLDINEGADIVMIKPALSYLDVIAAIKAKVSLPVAAYQVSGEYSMIMAASEKGWIDQDQAMAESLLSIKRAGADMILTYFAIPMARLLASRAK
jgi:porphobilinogen synthase